ncbi:hypothetical protein [Aquimarina litoralis]|uniref:tetratricopeptide repeat protein n=1 Tax=Aquimarina litoralis TaxID=584605 RepID=UPI0031E47888
MSIFKVGIYLIISLIILLVIDGVFSKKEHHGGIIVEKKYQNNTGRAGGSSTGETPFAPIPAQKTDPKGFSFSIKGESNKTINVIPNQEMYYSTSIGDSIIYIKHKGLFTNILWNTVPHNIIKLPFKKDYSKVQKKTPLYKQLDKRNAQLHLRIQEIYKRSDKNVFDALKYADSLIKNDKFLHKENKTIEIQTIIGEILYDNNKIDLALDQFLLIKKQSTKNLKNDANIAGCYIKKQQYKQALELLKEASMINKDFKWLIGNYYEIIKSKANAVITYQELYESDKQNYYYCYERIKELNKPDTDLLTELKYLKRRERTILYITDSGGFDVIKIKY